MELRAKLKLLIIENETEADGLVRITLDQQHRTAQRLEGQIKTAKARKPKVPRVPKVKVPKVKVPRVKKVKL